MVLQVFINIVYNVYKMRIVRGPIIFLHFSQVNVCVAHTTALFVGGVVSEAHNIHVCELFG